MDVETSSCAPPVNAGKQKQIILSTRPSFGKSMQKQNKSRLAKKQCEAAARFSSNTTSHYSVTVFGCVWHGTLDSPMPPLHELLRRDLDLIGCFRNSWGQAFAESEEV